MASRDSGFGHGASFNNQALSAGITPRLRRGTNLRQARALIGPRRRAKGSSVEL